MVLCVFKWLQTSASQNALHYVEALLTCTPVPWALGRPGAITAGHVQGGGPGLTEIVINTENDSEHFGNFNCN